MCDARVAEPRLRAATIDWDRMRKDGKIILALLDQGVVLQRLHAVTQSNQVTLRIAGESYLGRIRSRNGSWLMHHER